MGKLEKWWISSGGGYTSDYPVSYVGIILHSTILTASQSLPSALITAIHDLKKLYHLNDCLGEARRISHFATAVGCIVLHDWHA